MTSDRPESGIRQNPLLTHCETVKGEEDRQGERRRRTSKGNPPRHVYHEKLVSFNSTLFDMYGRSVAEKRIVGNSWNRDTCFEIALEDERRRRTRETRVPFRGDWHLMRQWPYHAYESRVPRFWFTISSRLTLTEPHFRTRGINLRRKTRYDSLVPNKRAAACFCD